MQITYHSFSLLNVIDDVPNICCLIDLFMIQMGIFIMHQILWYTWPVPFQIGVQKGYPALHSEVLHLHKFMFPAVFGLT